MTRNKSFLSVAAIALGVAAAALGWRQWQGPAVAAYRIEALPLVQTVVATGRVMTPTRVQIGSEITAVALERRVQEGDQVEAGAVLAVLRAEDLAARVREAEAAIEQLERGARPQAEAALREAQALLEQATREAQRRRDLFEQRLIARESLEQAEQSLAVARAAADTARVRLARLTLGDADETVLRARLAAAEADLAKTQVRASAAGTVLTRNVEPGDVVQPGQVLFELAPAGVTEILLPLDEKNLAVLEIGQAAQCVADAFPRQPFEAIVSLIAPIVDAQRGTVDVRLTVNAVPDFLRQDMTVSVNIETGRRERALTVPNDAVATAPDGSTSVLVLRDGRAVRVPIELGLRGLTRSEITSGLADGELVIADATVEAGDRVRARVLAPPAS